MNQAHTKRKDEASNEKAQDKESACNNTSVWTTYLQAVLLCPNTKASSIYYKTKLQVHNLTLFNLKSKEGHCYVWNETDCDLRSDVFAYLQYSHFERIITENPTIEDIVIWSDGCGHQNRNVTVTNAFSELFRKHGVLIKQKYLVAGHTQLEYDGIHSSIE